jgi:kumamolisin
VFGGTSAVAPLWAALIALLNAQSKKSVGFLNSVLY